MTKEQKVLARQQRAYKAWVLQVKQYQKLGLKGH